MNRPTDERSTAEGSRAQSEVIGYAFVFSTVIVAVTVVVLFGAGALDQIQSSTAAENGEVAMEAVAEDLEALALGTATTRTSELTLESGDLETGPPTTFNVTGKRVEVSGTNIVSVHGKRSVNRTYRPIVFKTGDTDVLYSNTLVIRDQERGEVAVNDPAFAFSATRSVVPVVATNASVQSIGGGTQQIRSVRRASEGITVTNASASGTYRVAVNVTVETLPDRATVWKRTLEDRLEGVPIPASESEPCTRLRDTAVGCDFLTGRLVSTGTNVTYEFE